MEYTNLEDRDEPFIIPSDIYDEMCEDMNVNEINLLGIA